MRILQVITSLRTGGAEKIVADIVPRLRSMGEDVDVALLDGEDTPFKEKLIASGCKVYSFRKSSSVYNPLAILWLRRLMKRYDVVHTHNSSPQLFAASASVFSPAALVTTEHNTFNRRRRWKWYSVVDKWMYGRYDSVICISDQAYDNLVSYLGKSSSVDKTRVIYNGVDIRSISQSEGLDRKTVCPESAGKFVVTMVAGFRPQKDQDTLIRAMAILPDNFMLWLVGDGERREELESMTERLHVTDKVKFWGVRTDIPAILHASDAIVMSSHYEGLSLSSLEGMSVGKPFVASDVDGLREVITGAGELFPCQDEAKLAGILLRLSEDEAYRESVAGKCHARALQYDIDKMVEGYREVYLSLKLK